LKRLSSQQTFSIRAPYGRISEDLNRLAVLGGTSNDTEVINDPTGNRRIIPVNLLGFDIDKYKKIDKTKLFIELYNEWKQDKKAWFLNSKEINFLNQINVKNTEVCIEEEILAGTSESPFAEITATEIKIAIEMKYPTIKTSTKRIGMTLKKLGFEQIVVKRNGTLKRIYKVYLDLQ
jgi:predicted P-loop ATPase